MEFKESELKKHIKEKKFLSLYLFSGEEKFLVKHYTQRLIEAVFGKTPPEFNYHTFDSTCNIDDIAVATDVMPFMSEYNFVKVTDLNLENLNKTDLDKVKEIIKRLPQTTILLLTFPTLNTGGKNFSSINTIVKKSGVTVDFKKFDSHAISKQLVTAAGKRGAMLSLANAGKIVDYCGTDLTSLQNEIDKLSAYADGKEITIDMINDLVHINLETKVYYMAEDVIAGRLEKAYREIDILFYQKTEPIAIVNAIATAYIDLYRSRVASESGVPIDGVAREFNYGKRAFVLNKSARTGRNISTYALRESIDEIITADTKLKSTSADGRVIVEKLIAKLSLIARENKNA